MTTRKTIDIKQAKTLIGGRSAAQLRRWMWAHGFDPAVEGTHRQHRDTLWWLDEVEQMVEERKRWGLWLTDPVRFDDEDEDEEQTWMRAWTPEQPKAPTGEVWRPLTDQRYDYDAARKRREALAAQLDAAPVAATDIDYLATRGKERRPRGARGIGPTQAILAAKKHNPAG